MTEMCLDFHHLTFVDEGDEVVVGRPDADSYAVFPRSAAELLARLSEGMPVSQAADWYAEREGETVDMDDFLATLRELEFLREGDDEQVTAPVSLRWLGRAVFSPVAFACYALLAAACAWVLITVPAARPGPGNIFFSDSLLLVEVAMLVGGSLGIGLHESFHVLAGRRLGLPSKLGVGRRLYFVVFETTLNGLLGVPRRQRYLPFLAGMLADALIFIVLTLVAVATRDTAGVMPLPGRLCLAMAYLTMLRFGWQFYFFLRTDLYFVVTTMLGCQDLHGATRARLHNLGRRLRLRSGAEVDESAWTDRDRRLVAWYAPFLVIGVIALIAVAFLALLPAALQAVGMVFDALVSGAARPHFWDSLAFLVIGFWPMAAAVVMRIREWLRTRSHTSPDRAEPQP